VFIKCSCVRRSVTRACEEPKAHASCPIRSNAWSLGSFTGKQTFFFSTCALEFQICHLVLDPEEEKLPFPSRSVCLSIHHSSSDRRFPFHPSLILQPKSDSIPGTQRTIKLHKRLLAAVQGGGLPLGPSHCPRRIHRRSPSDGNKRGLCSCPKR
jgi:hypothetical protein